jgi:antigen flippase
VRASAARSGPGQILEASALIGGSTLLTLAIGIVRNKLVAVLIGPVGMGLIGLFSSVLDLAVSLAGMGVKSSAVRQIAAATGSSDADRIACTVLALRRLSLALGAIGGLALAALSRPVSAWTFGDEAHAADVMLLSVAVFLSVVAGGQSAFVQATRRLGDLVRIGVSGALLGLLVGVPVVVVLRAQGAAVFLVAIAAATLAASWWYSRKIEVPKAAGSADRWRGEAWALLKLGFAFMGSGLLMMGAAYLVRLIVVRHAGLDAAGLYQSAWTVGGLYTGFVLHAMGTDFYPRLVAVASDNAACTRVVNEQAQVSMLLAGPGLVATIALAPLAMAVLYTAEFSRAVELLRWICLGMALRIVTWPMGFIMVAQGRQQMFLVTELAWAAANVAMAWAMVRSFGLDGAGMAFLGAYVVYGLLLYPVVRRLAGFRWSRANVTTGMFFLGSSAVAFAAFRVLPFAWATALGVSATLLSAIHSIRTLAGLVDEDLPASVRRLATRLRKRT